MSEEFLNQIRNEFMEYENEIKERKEWNESTELYEGGLTVCYDRKNFFVLRRPKDCQIYFPDSEWYPSGKTLIDGYKKSINNLEKKLEERPDMAKYLIPSINRYKQWISETDPNMLSDVVHFAPDVKCKDAIEMIKGKRDFKVIGFMVFYS